MGTWAGIFSWRGVPRSGDAKQTTGECLRLTVLSSNILALLLMIGRAEQIPDSKCVVVGDPMLRNDRAVHADMMVESFQGIKTEQLHAVREKRNLGGPETVFIHVGTNDLRTTKNLGFVVEDVYALVATAMRKLPNCRLVLCGVL